MSRAYRMESTTHGRRLTVIDHKRKHEKAYYYPTPASFDRITAIAEKAAAGKLPGTVFQLCRSEDGYFGWWFTQYVYRPCPTCQRIICEYEDEYKGDGKCFMCGLDERCEAAANVAVAEFMQSRPDVFKEADIKALIVQRPKLTPEPDGDVLWA